MRKLISLLMAVCMLLTFSAVFTTAMGEEPVKLTVFIDHTWYSVDYFTGIIPEEITRKTGVTLEPTVAADASQLGVLLASGDYPDLIYTFDNISACSNSDVAYDYLELIEKYNIDWQPTDMQLAISRLYSDDGGVYCIKNQIVSKEEWDKYPTAVPMLSSIQIRKGIYDECGAPELKSLQDLSNFFAMAKEKHPELVCLGMNVYSWGLRPLLDNIGIGSLPFVPVEEGSETFRHYTEDPRYLDLLIWLNDCFNKGYISVDDGYFHATDKTTIPAENYLTHLHCTQTSLRSYNNGLKEVGVDDVFFEMVPFDTANFTYGGTGWSGTFITKSCKDPEAAIRLMAFLFSEEGQKLTQMGREGYEYTIDADGNYIFSDEWKAARAAGTASQIYNTSFYFGGSPIVEALSRLTPDEAPYYKDAYAVMREKYDSVPLRQAAEPAGSGDDVILLQKLNELRIPMEARMIQAANEDEVRALYDEYITKAKQIGLEEIDNNYNTKYQELKPLFGT